MKPISATGTVNLFELTVSEKEEVVAKCDHLESMKFSPVLPLAYTEHGALMAALF
jgi:hypothetical protein